MRRAGQRYYYQLHLAPAAPRDVGQDLDQFFWSGVGDTTELKAAELAGAAAGVTVLTRKEATPIGSTLLKAVAELPPDVGVFVDSGAYGAESGGLDLDTLTVRGRPAWEFVFDVYRQIATERPAGTVSLVAPDKVGSQAQTLHRIRVHARELRDLAQRASLLVALQPGKLPPWEFARRVDRLLGERWIPALPLANWGAASRYFTPAVLERFVAERRPSVVHLLGAGPSRQGRESRTSRVAPALRAAAREAGFPIWIQADSALTRAMTKTIREFRDGVRQRYAPDELGFFQVGGGEWAIPGMGIRWHFDLTEDWPEAFERLTSAERRWAARQIVVAHDDPGPARLTREERRRFVADPAGFLRSPPRPLSAEDKGFWELADQLVMQEALEVLVENYSPRLWDIRSAGLHRYVFPGRRPRPIGLIACGEAKCAPGRGRGWRGPARELYTGSLFRDQRGYVEAAKMPYFILSAQHGLLEPAAIVGIYSKRLASGLKKRTRWANRVVGQLERTLGSLRGRLFELHAGRDYLEPLSGLLARRGASVRSPLRGADIFARRRFYKEARS